MRYYYFFFFKFPTRSRIVFVWGIRGNGWSCARAGRRRRCRGMPFLHSLPLEDVRFGFVFLKICLIFLIYFFFTFYYLERLNFFGKKVFFKCLSCIYYWIEFEMLHFMKSLKCIRSLWGRVFFLIGTLRIIRRIAYSLASYYHPKCLKPIPKIDFSVTIFPSDPIFHFS